MTLETLTLIAVGAVAGSAVTLIGLAVRRTVRLRQKREAAIAARAAKYAQAAKYVVERRRRELKGWDGE